MSRPQSRSQNLDDLGTGYLLIEYIEEAHEGMVSCTQNEKNRHKKKPRSNLFRSLSRILLALSRVPLPLIASLAIDDGRVLEFSKEILAA
jgi:hypothetical protein